jgi:hypothetical protein
MVKGRALLSLDHIGELIGFIKCENDTYLCFNMLKGKLNREQISLTAKSRANVA